MSEITYVRGDATAPLGKGVKLIAHVCNDIGGWGKGFVLALSNRWPEPEAAYRRWHRERAGNDFGLGAAQFVQVDRYVWVANMIGQRGILPQLSASLEPGGPPSAAKASLSGTRRSTRRSDRSPTRPSSSARPSTCRASDAASRVGSGRAWSR
jgi:hypothetical protein